MAKKVLLVWPVFQALYPRPYETFAQICIAAGRQQDYLFGVKVLERMSLVTGMNLIGQVVREQEWDAVIVFDDDCFPPLDVVPRLLTRCFDEGHPFVAAAGVMRNYPFTTTAARYYPEGVAIHEKDGSLAGYTWLDELPNELTDVDFCGVPAAIIHRRVFEAVPAPWFGDQDENGQRMTHDVYFCRKVKAAGFAVKVDGTMRCGHLLDAPIVTFENRLILRGTA